MKNQNRKRVFIALLTSTMVLYPSISAYAMDPERERSHSSSAPHKLHNNNNFTSPSEKNSWEKITRTPQQLGLKMTLKIIFLEKITSFLRQKQFLILNKLLIYIHSFINN